jgi:hypothetical protein
MIPFLPDFLLKFLYRGPLVRPGCQEIVQEYGIPLVSQGFLQQSFNESVTQAVILSGIEQKSQEIGVAQLDPHCANGFEDIELIQQSFQPLQVRVIDHQSLQRF